MRLARPGRAPAFPVGGQAGAVSWSPRIAHLEAPERIDLRITAKGWRATASGYADETHVVRDPTRRDWIELTLAAPHDLESLRPLFAQAIMATAAEPSTARWTNPRRTADGNGARSVCGRDVFGDPGSPRGSRRARSATRTAPSICANAWRRKIGWRQITRSRAAASSRQPLSARGPVKRRPGHRSSERRHDRRRARLTSASAATWLYQ